VRAVEAVKTNLLDRICIESLLDRAGEQRGKSKKVVSKPRATDNNHKDFNGFGFGAESADEAVVKFPDRDRRKSKLPDPELRRSLTISS
jgi:hypothetical protein